MATVFTTAIAFLVLLIPNSSPSVYGISQQDVDCTSVMLSMVSCLPFVTIGSEVDTPSSSCCTGLKTVLDASPKCLCQVLKDSDSFGFKMNITKAATLPVLCKVNAPPISACGLSTNPPAAAPSPGL